MIAVLRKANPAVRFSLETITRDPLRVPCLGGKYWLTLGDVPRGDLERTLSTVRAHCAAALPANQPSAGGRAAIRNRTR